MSQFNSLAQCWQRRTSGSGRLPVLYTYAISSASGSSSWRLSLSCNFVAPVCALCCLGPLLCLLIPLNFLAQARKDHRYYTASSLPPFISFNLSEALFSLIENDLCLRPPWAGISKDCMLLFLIFLSLFTLLWKLVNQSKLLQQPVGGL